MGRSALLDSIAMYWRLEYKSKWIYNEMSESD